MKEVPAIVRYGRALIDYYTEPEYRAALRRAFGDHGADFITLDDNPRGQKFLAACVAWAMSVGILFCSATADDGQSVVSSFRLTDKGRTEILDNG